MKKLTVLVIASILIFLALTPAGMADEAGAQPLVTPTPLPYAPGEVLVKFQPHVGLLGMQSLRAAGLQILETLPRSGLIRVKVGSGQESETIADLLARGDVEYATLNYRLQAMDSPNDPYFNSQWSLQENFLNAPDAWTVYSGTGNITVAVVDTGIDLDHEDLQANLWTNSAEIPGNGLDDDGNSYIDDVYGYDFYNNDSDPSDDHGHGTHVAGIAAAVGNNGVGVSGVSWGAKIMPVKVLDSTGNGYISDVAEGVYYAVDNGAQVINMSLGARDTSYPCTGFEAVQDAMQYALDHGALVMVAAGNEGASAVSCPAAYDQAMAVGATDSTDTRAYYSNYGPRLDITAPGSSIYSTWVDGSYGYMSGTSMATPHVAGLAALIWSYAPSLSNTQVRELIQTTADDLGSPGWDEEYGYGRINAAAAFVLKTPLSAGVYLPNDGEATEDYTTVTIETYNPKTITWTATISPSVSWLEFASASSGTVASSSPATVTLHGLQPVSDPVSTTLVVNGVTESGETTPLQETTVYVWTQRYYLPLIMR